MYPRIGSSVSSVYMDPTSELPWIIDRGVTRVVPVIKWGIYVARCVTKLFASFAGVTGDRYTRIP